MLVTDAQVHLWEDGPRVPSTWPRLHGQAFTAEDLLARMDEAGVARAVLVPPAFVAGDNELSLEAARRHPTRLAVMGRIDLTDPRAREDVSHWLDTPGMLGIRLSFSNGAAARWLDDGTASWLWGPAEDARIPVMVFTPDLLGRVAEIAGAHPRLPLVVDHLALRVGVRDEVAVDKTVSQLVELAAHDNVAVKASCLPSNAWDSYPHAGMLRQLRRVVDAFGARRVFWGSDLTRLPCTYEQAVDMVMHSSVLADDELALVMGRGLSDWLGWAEPE